MEAPRSLRRARAAVALATITGLALLAGACSTTGRDAVGASGTTPVAPTDAVGDRGPTGSFVARDDAAPVRGGRLVFGLNAETNGWNPGMNQWADAGHFVGSTIFEPLAVQDRDGRVEPYLAESIEPATPGRFDVWRVRLRPDVTFHDGTPLDAAALKLNLDFYTNEQALTSLALRSMFDTVTVVDPRTVEVRLKSPWATFPVVLAVGGTAYVMAPAMIRYDTSGAFVGDTEHPIGTGPFRFVSWRRGENLFVERNPSYRLPDQPHLDSIEFRVLPDDADRSAELAAGRLDAMVTTRADEVARLQDTFTTVKDYTSERTFVLLDTAEVESPRNPFANVHARRALAHATDRQALAAALGPDIHLSSSPFEAGSAWGDAGAEEGYPAFDQARARQEVAAYLTDTGATELTFTFAGLDNLEDQRIMQILQAQWAEVGVRTELLVTDQPRYITPIALGYHQAAYFRNYAYRDPDTDFVFWHSSTAKGPGAVSLNFSQHHTPEIDEALERGRRSDDPAVRREAYRTVVRARNEAVTDIWLFDTPWAIVADPAVHGLDELGRRGFANYDPKPWVAALWIDESSTR